MEPWQSWAIMLAGGALAYWYYTSRNQPKSNKARAATDSEPVQLQAKPNKRRDDNKPRRKTEDTSIGRPVGSDAAVTSSDEPSRSVVKDQGKKRKAGPDAPAPAAAISPVSAKKDEPEQDNQAWAQQMASVRKGTTLEAPARAGAKNRTVRPTSAVDASPAISSASSTGGAEADDDLTPARSPALAAGDISDMLEKQAPGPSVLRLTGSSDSSSANKARPQKEFQPAETKKQRQNRKKLDDRKLEREAAERERQSMMENQRRTAREARGEPARNGIPIGKPPAVSAWAAQTINRVTEAPVPSTTANGAPLLDTFEPESSLGVNDSAAATSTTSRQFHSDNDATGIATSADQTGWNTVGKKKQRKANSDTEEVASPPVIAEKPAVAAPVVQPTKAPSNNYALLDVSSTFDAGSHPDDSQWSA